MRTTVVIPAYNPSPAMVRLTRHLIACGHDVCIVDDGSSVGLEAFGEAREAGADVLFHGQNRGKGVALRTAFAHLVDTHFEGAVVTADADGQHLVYDIIRVAQAVAGGPDNLVLGVRDIDAMPGRSRLGNRLTERFLALRYGIHVSDTQTGLRGFWSGYLPHALTIPGDRYEYEVSALLGARDEFSGIVQVPIATVYDDGNTTSHFSPIADSLRIARFVLGDRT